MSHVMVLGIEMLSLQEIVEDRGGALLWLLVLP